MVSSPPLKIGELREKFFETFKGKAGFVKERKSMTQEQMKRLDYVAMVELGKKMLSNLPKEFVEENHGKFVAIGLKSGKIITVRDSLEELNQELRENRPQEDYYLEHLGHEYLTEYK